MTRIGIIRHGATAWNKEGRDQGSSDIPLDQEGISQAHKLAERLSKEEWHIIYTSNLLRAAQTAKIIAKRIGNVPIQYDARLREQGGGQIEGTTEAERIIRWGKNWRELDLGIESTESIITRGISFIAEVTNKYSNKNILIISHGSFIRKLLKELNTNLSIEDPLKNTSLTKLLKTGNGWEGELYNCIIHLNEESV